MFGTLVGAFVFSVMWSEVLMTSAITCPLWSSVCECQRVECAFTSPVRTECGMVVMYCMQCQADPFLLLIALLFNVRKIMAAKYCPFSLLNVCILCLCFLTDQ